MRTTPEAELAELAAARIALHGARHGLANAERDAADAHAPASSPLDEAATAHSVRVALLERRERDALAAQARGDRRRGRARWWRQALGLRAASPAAAPRPTVREATTRFLEQPAGAGEDMHPSALDPVEADLHDALAREGLARRVEEREARDA